MSHELPYRPCVGVALINGAGDAFIGHRKRKRSAEVLDARSWQMPQGGIDAGEEPLAAAKRELWEETSVRSVELIAELPGWLKYDLPDGARGRWSGHLFQRRFASVVMDEAHLMAAARPRNGSCSGSSARTRKSTSAARLTAPTRPNSTTGGGSASSGCRSLSCRSNVMSTRPSRRRSRRSRVPPGGEQAPRSYFPALTDAVASAISSSIFLRRR